MHHVSVGPLDQNVELACDSPSTTIARNYVTDLDEDMIDVFADHFKFHGCRLNARSLIGQSPMLFLFGSHAHVWDNDFESYDPKNVAGTGLPNIGGDMGVRVSQTVAQIQSYKTDAPVDGMSAGTFGIVYINKLVPGVTLTLGNLSGTGAVLNGQQVTVAKVLYVAGGASFFTTTRTLRGGPVAPVTCSSQCGLGAARPANDNKIDHNLFAMPFIAVSTGNEANGTVFDNNTMSAGPELGTLAITGLREAKGLLTLTTRNNAQEIVGEPVTVTGYSIAGHTVTVHTSGGNFPFTQRVVLSGLKGPAGLALNGTILTVSEVPSSSSFRASYSFGGYFSKVSVDANSVGTFTMANLTVGVGYTVTLSGCPAGSAGAAYNGQTVTVSSVDVAAHTFSAQLAKVAGVNSYAPPLASCGFRDGVAPRSVDSGTALVPLYVQLHNLSAKQVTRQQNERYLNVVSSTPHSVTLMANDASETFPETADLGSGVVYHGEGECCDINSGDNGGDGTIVSNNIINAATLPAYQESASGVTWIGNQFNYVGDQQNEALRIHLAQGVADRSMVANNSFVASPWQEGGVFVFGNANHTSIVGNHFQGFEPYLKADGSAQDGPGSGWIRNGSGVILAGPIGYTAVMSNSFAQMSGSAITVLDASNVHDLHIGGNMIDRVGRYGVEYIYPFGETVGRASSHQLIGNSIFGARLGFTTGCVGCMELDGDGNQVKGNGYSLDSAGNLKSSSLRAGDAGQVQVLPDGSLIDTKLRATSGTRYVCVDTEGRILSSATPCSGR
jgi:hypothetical protein